MIIVRDLCKVTGKEYVVAVPREGYNKWKNGMLIQDALPELNTNQREFLISGISPEGWELMFGTDEEV